MQSTITINGTQRQVLYELVLDHLSAIGDLALALRKEDYSTAANLGIQFEGDLRLMGDLGWNKAWREEATLTMGLADLAPVLHRLQRDAEGGLSESTEEREAREAEEAARRRYRYGAEICKGLLLLLDHPETGR